MNRGPPDRSTAERGRDSVRLITKYSTDSVPQHSRLDYWVGALSETLFSMVTTTRSRDDFSCHLAATQLDGLVLSRAHGSNQTSFRTRKYALQSTRRSFHLIGDFSKSWIAVRNGEYIHMRAGDLILTDTNEIHGGMWQDSCRVTNLVLPPVWLCAWVGQPSSIVGHRIDASQGWGKALSTFVSQLSPEMAAATSVPLSSIGDHLGVMLSMIETQMAGGSVRTAKERAVAERNLAAVTDVLRQRLGESELDAQAVASSLDIPVEQLHRWLLEAGRMFGPLLQRERIAVASDMLTSRRFDDLGSAEIGRRVGIDNAARFTRLVRRHLGESPLEHRRAAID